MIFNFYNAISTMEDLLKNYILLFTYFLHNLPSFRDDARSCVANYPRHFH